MKKLLAMAVVVALGTVGCESKSPPGGPGAQKTTTSSTSSTTADRGTAKGTGDHSATTTTTTTTARGQSAETFKLVKPSTTELKQGEAKEVTVKIDRGRDFKEPVMISFEQLPKGVTLEPATAEIQPGHDQAVFKVKTTNDTPVGDAMLNVLAKPKTGESVRMEMKVKVDKGGTAR